MNAQGQLHASYKHATLTIHEWDLVCDDFVQWCGQDAANGVIKFGSLR